LTYLRRNPKHIPLHRLWAFATLQNDLVLPEHAHILDCEDCRTSLRVCLKSESFGAVLLELKREDDSGEEPAFDFQDDMEQQENDL